MKLAWINPIESGRWWRYGSERKCGQWTYADLLRCDGVRERYVKHHGTVMGLFTEQRNGWVFSPVSVGWGSVSDQGGMNKIMPTGWKFRRNGGHARYEFNGVEFKC